MSDQGLDLPAWVLELLRCPAGGGRLRVAQAAGLTELQCEPSCGCVGGPRAYPVDDGIPVLLIDEARSLAP